MSNRAAWSRRSLLRAAWVSGGGWLVGYRAWAAMSPSQEVKALLPGAQLQGSGRFRYFGLSIYEARLWVEERWSGEGDLARPLVLELVYLRDLSGRAIAERSIQEMRRIGPMTASQAQQWLDALTAALPDVSAGDRLQGLYQPGTGARFFHNGRATRDVADAAFARLFFGVWLSPQTSAPDLRRALLGQG